MENLKELIINHLKRNHESVQEFSERAKVDFTTVYRYLNGSRPRGPYQHTAEKLYKAINEYKKNNGSA